MRSTHQVEVLITLQLNYDEAEWLKELLQNPIVKSMGRNLPVEETSQNKRMRELFFDALSVERTNHE